MPDREAFTYESNVSLLREFLVPDPFPRDVWELLQNKWGSTGKAGTFLQWLVSQGHIPEGSLLEYLASAAGVEVFHERISQNPKLDSPEAELLRNFGFHPLSRGNGRYLVTGGPCLAPDLSQYLGAAADNWKWVLVSPLWGTSETTRADSASHSTDTEPALSNCLQQLLLGLWSRNVTDIHFERTGVSLQIRIHESGSMHKLDTWHGNAVESSLRLLKTWSGLSTAMDSLPQDGRLSLQVYNSSIQFRASHITTINGESLVLRNLQQQNHLMQTDELGLPARLRATMRDVMLNDPGIIIVSGPTGSGKTTTAYALLNELHGKNRKILTIEDPVEHDLPHVTQSDVNLNFGWTFDQAIKAYLRQDPDIIFLGEMRDADSAKAAFRAALTGHCVLATLHARSNAAATNRLTAWGIPEGLLSETLRLIVNQRLVIDHQTGRRKAEFAWETISEAVAQAV